MYNPDNVEYVLKEHPNGYAWTCDALLDMRTELINMIADGDVSDDTIVALKRVHDELSKLECTLRNFYKDTHTASRMDDLILAELEENMVAGGSAPNAHVVFEDPMFFLYGLGEYECSSSVEIEIEDAYEYVISSWAEKQIKDPTSDKHLLYARRWQYAEKKGVPSKDLSTVTDAVRDLWTDKKDVDK